MSLRETERAGKVDLPRFVVASGQFAPEMECQLLKQIFTQRRIAASGRGAPGSLERPSSG
jgi:hypothetical protein